MGRYGEINPKQGHAPPLLEQAPHLGLHVLDLVGPHLVEHDAADAHPLVRKHHPVHLELVEGLADAAVGHEHDLRSHHRGGASVGDLHHAADADVAGPLGQHHIRAARDGLVRSPDGRALRLVGHFVVDVPSRVSRRDDDGAHRRVGHVVELEVLLHDLHVLIDAKLVAALVAHRQVLLPDGLQEADLVEPFLQAAHQRQADGGLSDMLPRGRDEDGWLWHR
mmetsp:Transcript_5229/g.17413  ORF Transcript_5229/g.17413 Transcript_5229/m.17413 type:complete len:222 (-) Transcript_5229:69-734(-)